MIEPLAPAALPASMELNYTQRLLFQSLAVLTVLRWILAGLLDLTPAGARLLREGHVHVWVARRLVEEVHA